MSTISKPVGVVLITGCSLNSIGSYLALEFHHRGYDVIATARSLASMSHLKDMGIQTMTLDLSSEASIAAFASQIEHIDILFNNAGTTWVGPLTDVSSTEFRRLFETNVFGTFELTRALIPKLIASKGLIVNHTSQAAHVFSVYFGAYAASKAALASLTNTLRLELSPFDVRVVELVTSSAVSNLTGSMHQTKLAEGSLYEQIREDVEPILQGRDINGKMLPGDVYARQVVGDLLNETWGAKKWIWRGYKAGSLRLLLCIDAVWKGSCDWLFLRATKLSLLKKKLKQSAVAEEGGLRSGQGKGG